MFFHSREFLGMIASYSRSRIVGMEFFIPFPFPNCGNGLFSFPSRSWICHFTDGNWNTLFVTRLPIFSASSTFLTTIYIEEVNWAKEFKSEWLKRQDILLSLTNFGPFWPILAITSGIYVLYGVLFTGGATKLTNMWNVHIEPFLTLLTLFFACVLHMSTFFCKCFQGNNRFL